MKDIQLNWTDFKSICIKKKKLNVQYVVNDGCYNIFAVENYVFWYINIPCESDEAKEFEKKYKKEANKRIEG